jgi:CSLREA domain-containing protein
VAAAALLVCASPSIAAAQEIAVTTTEDGGDGNCDDGTCTLRDAVTEAGARDDHPTVVLKAETYALTQGQLVLAGRFTIEGAGSRETEIDSNGEGRVGYVAPDAEVTVSGLTVTDGVARGDEDDTLGGGFRVAAGAELELSRAMVTDNFAAAAGGGIATAGALHIIDSTVSYNVAGDGSDPGGRGGGIHVEAGGEAVLVNATVSRNSALPDGDGQPSQGGGIHTAGSFTMEHVTIAENDATEGGGLYQARSAEGEMAMWNTLFATNFEQSCAGAVGLIEESHNLADDTSCDLGEVGDLQNAFAVLLPLDDHGGPTDTHALGLGSEAINAATKEHCPAADQRLFPRPESMPCDIGAVERRLPPLVNTHADGDDGTCAREPDDCTLREALRDSEYGSAIVLDEGEYEVTLGELQLSGARSIFGVSARATRIAAHGGHRVLAVVDGQSLVTDVQITGGTAADGQVFDVGGGVLVDEGSALTLFEAAVKGNTAAAGGGVANRGVLSVASSTIASNDAIREGGTGGGVLTDRGAFSVLVDSTVSGNTATAMGGGIANLGGTFEAIGATIANNEAATGAGVFGSVVEPDGLPMGDTTLVNTVVAANTGDACEWDPDHDLFARHSLDDDGSCFADTDGNLPGTDARIGALADTFGDTDVHPLLDGSPAIDAGDNHYCGPFDQRGASRVGVCDIGAFEGGGAATALEVVTVVADGPAQPSDFTVHVFSAGEEIDSGPGSPAGRLFALEPGTYRVTRSGPDGYVPVFSGDCDRSGEVVLDEGVVATCTITLDHVAAPAETCVDYPTFAQPAGLSFVGSAAVVGDQLHLNPDTGGVGAAWLAARRPVADGFSADFDFRITPPGGGADGFAFVIQNHASEALGESGGGLGYQGIPNSLAVEFDTWTNGGDPGTTHVAVHSLGTSPNSAVTGQLAVATLESIRDGERHHARVVYSPGRLHLFVDDMDTPRLSLEIELSAWLNLEDGAAFAGFTAATGAVVEGHRVERWKLCSVQDSGTLRVITQVVNDNGGALSPAHFTVHVQSGGADVPGSPRPGSASGTSYAVTQGGTYRVAVDAPLTYTISIGGACAADGAVTGRGGQSTCTVTANDVAPPPPPVVQGSQQELPAPKAGEQVNALPRSGTVRVRVAGTKRFVDLRDGRQIPVGSVVDTTKGRVTIVAAGNQSADFYDGIFRLTQGKGARPLTTLTLVEALSCPKAGRAVAAAKKKKRRLWGDGNGRFRTKGKHSAATVVGTRWLVEDRCTSTLTRVVRGRVSVRDFVKKKTVTVRAGKKYVARAKR